MTLSDVDFHWPWSELDLDPSGCSARDIKRAYAKKLKAIDTEQDPEAFQNLRSAYEYARDCASMQHDTPPTQSDVPAVDADAPDAEAAQTSKYEVVPANSAPVEPEFSEIEEVFDFNALVADMSSLVAAGNFFLGSWQAIMADLFNASIIETQNFEYALIDQLAAAGWNKADTFNQQATAAWVELIEERFEWVADGVKFQRDFPQYFLVQRNFQNQFQKWAQVANNKKPYKIDSRPTIVTEEDKQLPFYFKWWFIFGLYLVLKFILTELGSG